MNVKGVFNNLKKNGLLGVYRTRKERNEQRQAIAQLVQLFDNLEESTPEERLSEIVGEVRLLLRKSEPMLFTEDMAIVIAQIEEKETGAYRREAKRQYVKEILPAVYEKHSKEPTQNKILFFQPRRGLNQSCHYIYNKIKKEHPEYRLKLHELHRGEVPAALYYHNAETFIKDMATAKTVFVHESNNLFGYLNLRDETKVIQLWHGCGVYKKIGLSMIDDPNSDLARTFEEYPPYKNYSLVTIASPEVSWVFEEFMGIDKNEGIIQPLGVARTDVFFDKEYIAKAYVKLYQKIPAAKEKKVILYAPTYRGLDPSRVSPNALDVEKFAEELGEEYILVFKHHQTAVEVPKISREHQDTFAYDMTRGKGMSIGQLMAVADVCISDYSSLVFEYALFERPLLFFVFDLEEYIDERGLYYNFDEITPGPLCRTNEEMIGYIKSLDENFDKQQVVEFKKKFMSACDGHSSDRIIKFIEE